MIREFRLSPPGSGRGVSWDANGAFFGTTPLLKQSSGKDRWEPRDCNDLSEQIGKQFGLPIDFSSKAGGLKAISNALNDGNVARAQIAAVLLGIPDAPALSKGSPSRSEMIKFIRDLHWSGMIKWDQAKFDSSSQSNSADAKSQKTKGALAKAGYNPNEPRDGRGRWTDGASDNAHLIPAQAAIAEPLIGPLFGEAVRPFPGTIDVAPPMVNPRAQNPYPDRPECAEEWAAAKKFCDDLKRRGKLGQDGYRGFGKTYQQCLMGQISADCGGNPVA